MRSENHLRNLTNDFFVEQAPQDAALQAVFTAAQQEGKPFDLLVESEGSASFGNIHRPQGPEQCARPPSPLSRTSQRLLPVPQTFLPSTVTLTTPPSPPPPQGRTEKDALLWYLPLSPNSTRGGKVFHMDPKNKHGHGGE